MTIKQNFTGIITALITPFNKDLSIDHESLEGLLFGQVADGINGFVLAGSTGEAATLSLEERFDLIKTAKKVAPEQKIIVGAGHNSTDEAIILQGAMEKAGADATLQVVPYYNKPSKQGLLAHFKAIAQQANIPIILYNVPSRTGIDMPIDVILELLAEEPNIIGIKESNPSLEKLLSLNASLRSIRPDAVVLCGEDSLFLPFLAAGAQGIISVSSHLLAKEMRQIYSYINSNDLQSAQDLALKIHKIFEAVGSTTNPIGIKTILAHKKLIKNYYRLPLCRLSSPDEDAFISNYLRTHQG